VGVEVCPRLVVPAASNAFSACTGAITPQKEICNRLDDDCNGIVDDVPGGCDKICIPSAEICNGRDDNCNGIVDDTPVGEGDACVDAYDAAKAGVGICRPGRKRCVSGMLRCEGQIGPQPEICDGKDNNCDGNPDDNAPCPPSFSCLDGACQPACNPTEFPCAADRRCIDPTTREVCARASNAGCYCLPNVCLVAPCDRGRQDCVIAKGEASCVDRCPTGKCAAPTTCEPSNGQCVDCRTLGCPGGQLCVGNPGACQPDLCAAVTCADGQFCQEGTCRSLCSSLTCPAGQACFAGQCRPSMCDNVSCATPTICNPETGACERNLCESGGCLRGEVCVPKTGACLPDPCQTTRCPECTVCRVGYGGGADCAADMSCQRIVVTQKGGGWSCAVATGGAPSWGILLAVFALGLALSGRRRRPRRGPRRRR
jgi:hypothetical protein